MIDSEVCKIVESAIGEESDKEQRYQMLRKLSKLFKKAGMESSSLDFLQASVGSWFETIVRIAILDDDHSIRRKAKRLLKQLAQIGELRAGHPFIFRHTDRARISDHLIKSFPDLSIDKQALRYLEIAEEPTGSSNRAQSSAIIVLEMFAKDCTCPDCYIFKFF
jgi:hypothetical protein